MLSVLCAFVLCFGAQCHVVVVFLWVFCRLGSTKLLPTLLTILTQILLSKSSGLWWGTCVG
jgi:hypothetical protein